MNAVGDPVLYKFCIDLVISCAATSVYLNVFHTVMNNSINQLILHKPLRYSSLYRRRQPDRLMTSVQTRLFKHVCTNTRKPTKLFFEPTNQQEQSGFWAVMVNRTQARHFWTFVRPLKGFMSFCMPPKDLLLF